MGGYGCELDNQMWVGEPTRDICENGWRVTKRRDLEGHQFGRRKGGRESRLLATNIVHLNNKTTGIVTITDVSSSCEMRK